MGAVYRARDTRLGRIVAIRILPNPLADRVELPERFAREARTTAKAAQINTMESQSISRETHSEPRRHGCQEEERLSPAIGLVAQQDVDLKMHRL